ncbi:MULTISPECIES: hypothetical protein [Halorussus]|uniref:hypothetical protein n=1 Tax=Halorussus TaxID=1070314 RepID=UPI00209F13C0|nr:hypothetical protein [Halorussus vallis]USZ74765.1 hypothetical protein NGM07_15145 [Halorussus vallis]
MTRESVAAPSFWTTRRVRLAGTAGLVGGVGWALLAAVSYAAGANVFTPTTRSYAVLDALTPLALLLATVAVAAYRARTEPRWNRLAAVGFVALLVGLAGATVGTAASALGAVAGPEGWTLSLVGWEVSAFAYLLALLGAAAFGVGLLQGEVPPRVAAVSLAGALPVGALVSLGLGVAVGDEAVVPVGPALLLGAGVAALGRFLRTGREIEK